MLQKVDPKPASILNTGAILRGMYASMHANAEFPGQSRALFEEKAAVYLGALPPNSKARSDFLGHYQALGCSKLPLQDCNLPLQDCHLYQIDCSKKLLLDHWHHTGHKAASKSALYFHAAVACTLGGAEASCWQAAMLTTAKSYWNFSTCHQTIFAGSVNHMMLGPHA